MKKRISCMLLALSMSLPCWTTGALAAKVIEPIEPAVSASDEQMPDLYDYQMEGGTAVMEKLMQAGMGVEYWTGSHRVLFQTAAQYQSVKYGRGTIYSSACGPASLCNALYAAGLADVDIPTMCNLAVSCGARVTGGTNETTLLNAAAPKYNFIFEETSSSERLKEHLEAGGCAIVHAGTAYPLFTTSGHYLAAVGSEGDAVTMLDSYWYDDKYTSTKSRRENVTVLGTGVIQASYAQVAKACADRSPAYYLLYEKPVVQSAADKGDAPFTDVLEDAWYYNYVVNTYQNKLMSGTDANLFEPDTILTRAMVAQIMYANAGTPTIDAAEAAADTDTDDTAKKVIDFSDVLEEDWFSDAVTWAAMEGIVAGYGDGVFAPNDNITREQLAMILYRAADSPDAADTAEDTEQPDSSSLEASSEGEGLSVYSDASSVSDWAKDAVVWAVQNGIITGTENGGVITLDPQGSATRAQAAVMIMQYVKLLPAAEE